MENIEHNIIEDIDGVDTIQIHLITPYSATILNRDDNNESKRLELGKLMRTRISSQCLKRSVGYWVQEECDKMFEHIGKTFNSKNHFIKIHKELIDAGFPLNLVDEYTSKVKAIYSFTDKEMKKFNDSFKKIKNGDLELNATARMGSIEYDYFKKLIINIINDVQAGEFTIANELSSKSSPSVDKIRKLNDPGWISYMFGRFSANNSDSDVHAPIQVAHAFTTHEEQSFDDFFTTVDDHKVEDGEAGGSMLGYIDLSCGVYYSYSLIDCRGLLGYLKDPEFASFLINKYIEGMATRSPGAKKGSTAPNSSADLIYIKINGRQESLAYAFDKGSKPTIESAVEYLDKYIKKKDKTHGKEFGSNNCYGFLATAEDTNYLKTIAKETDMQCIYSEIRKIIK